MFQMNCSPDYHRLSISHCRPHLCAGYSPQHHLLHPSVCSTSSFTSLVVIMVFDCGHVQRKSAHSSSPHSCLFDFHSSHSRLPRCLSSANIVLSTPVKQNRIFTQQRTGHRLPIRIETRSLFTPFGILGRRSMGWCR